MTDMMAILEANAVPLVVALVIGVIVGWWIWARAGKGGTKAKTGGWEQPTEAIRNVWAEKPAPAANPPEAAIDAEGAAVRTEIGLPEATGEPDDLSRIKGLGPKLLTMLNGLGVTRYDQIAAWNPEQLAAIDARLGNFRGRPERDNWIEQARLLAADDTQGFEAKFGKLGGP